MLTIFDMTNRQWSDRSCTALSWLSVSSTRFSLLLAFSMIFSTISFALSGFVTSLCVFLNNDDKVADIRETIGTRAASLCLRTRIRRLWTTFLEASSEWKDCWQKKNQSNLGPYFFSGKTSAWRCHWHELYWNQVIVLTIGGWHHSGLEKCPGGYSLSSHSI